MSQMRIRQVKPSDAEGVLNLWKALDTETEFMLFEPGERQLSLEQQTITLENASNSEFVRIYILENIEQAEIAGFVAGRRNNIMRDRHNVQVTIGIKQQYTRRGWGQQLLGKIESWARDAGSTRLQLSVMTSNKIAIHLYEKSGFNIEGTRQKSVKLKSGYFDEYFMGKLIG